MYHAEEIINDKPSAKPNYWVLAKINGKSSIVTIEISETKDAHEIVGWHFANEKAMDKIRNRANREGGQVLITKSNAQGSSDLYDLPADTANTIPQSAEKSSGDSEKIVDKITSSPAGSNTRIMAFTELADGEHTVNGKTFTKSGNAFTLDGKELNAREIEKATRTKTEKIKATPKAEAETASGKKSDQSEKVDESGNTVLFSTVGDKKQSIEEINQNFNDDLDRQIAGTLPKGYIHQLGTLGDILLSTGVPNLPIELSATRLEEKSKQENHPFNIADLKNLPKMLQKPIGVFSYGSKDNAQNIIIEVQQNGRNYLVGLSFNFEHDGLIVNSIRGLFAKETAFWLRWIEQGKTLYINKEKVQNLIAQQRTNLADVNNLDLNSINNIIQNFENPSISAKNPENSSDEAKFSVPDIWTGSAADYDQPSLHHIGTGEGVQAFGWGLYGSSDRGIGEWYAKKDAAAKTTGIWHNGRNLYSAEETSKAEDWVLSAYDKLSDYDTKRTNIAEIREYLQNKLQDEQQFLDKIQIGDKRAENKIKAIKTALSTLEEYQIRFSDDPTGKRNLYRQTFFANKENHDLLDWNDRVPKSQREKILAQAKKEKAFDLESDFAEKLRTYENRLGKFLYQQLSDILGSPKAASEFLYRAGIVCCFL